VIDYKIYWATPTTNFVVLASTTTPSYTYTVGKLVKGT
jgi:hypothetical protein